MRDITVEEMDLISGGDEIGGAVGGAIGGAIGGATGAAIGTALGNEFLDVGQWLSDAWDWIWRQFS
ncbi:hypothetical protein [Nitrospirillum pindoramense]|uniref:Bacteriocin class II with double-glycine leader peptide n=1 Tax=Nitrospirillum amazonense TaxID=28077 RepID=A0A560HDT8_9PROT|nr:hypothetical protein [Nitrospirillum amazonense]TWB44527.1 hypothetical protein FBZ90_103436 [Nitrospirillum amazonense]